MICAATVMCSPGAAYRWEHCWSSFSSVMVMAAAQRWPFFTARRSHSGARVQSEVSVTIVASGPSEVSS
jgi:hypothetical protein